MAHLPLGYKKTGRQRNSDGYLLVQRPGHPNANARGYVLEHRLVMAQALGRPLLASETVHHINGVTSDNRIENLELRRGAHGRGATPDDLVRYAVEILGSYAPHLLRGAA